MQGCTAAHHFKVYTIELGMSHLPGHLAGSQEWMAVHVSIEDGGKGAGIWYHLSTFFNAGELGYAYAASATATAVGQVCVWPFDASSEARLPSPKGKIWRKKRAVLCTFEPPCSSKGLMG